MRFGPRGRSLVAFLAAAVATATLIGAGPATAHAAPSEDVVARARRLIGSPYSYGGTTPGGFDCSGFTMYVFAELGLSLPHSSGQQYALGDTKGFRRISAMSDLRPGDLIFHGSGAGAIQHVGIYIGDDRFISATSSSGIQIRSIHDGYWGPIYVGGVRTPVTAAEPRDDRERDRDRRRVDDPRLML